MKGNGKRRKLKASKDALNADPASVFSGAGDIQSKVQQALPFSLAQPGAFPTQHRPPRDRSVVTSAECVIQAVRDIQAQLPPCRTQIPFCQAQRTLSIYENFSRRPGAMSRRGIVERCNHVGCFVF